MDFKVLNNAVLLLIK